MVSFLVRQDESERVQCRHVVWVGSQEGFTDGLGSIEPPVPAERLGLLYAKETVLKYGPCRHLSLGSSIEEDSFASEEEGRPQHRAIIEAILVSDLGVGFQHLQRAPITIEPVTYRQFEGGSEPV